MGFAAPGVVGGLPRPKWLFLCGTESQPIFAASIQSQTETELQRHFPLSLNQGETVLT
jgi:hypothetical protein